MALKNQVWLYLENKTRIRVMGMIEDKIKADLMQSVYADSISIYEFIESRFAMDDKTRDEVIKKINTLNDDLINILKDTKLS